MMNRATLFVVAGLVVSLVVLAGPAQAAPVGELGKLDVTKDYGFGAGVNPATEQPWALGDAYHLIYVTKTLTDATSTDIAYYNAFVQADADAEGLGATWSVLGSTVDANAIDNAVITGPVFGISGSNYVAEDADDFWDYVFPVGGIIVQLDGSGKNVHTGTQPGGVQVSGRPLGSVGNVEREWSAWQNWAGANGNWVATTEAELVGISQQLQIIPEPATMALLGLGGLAMLRRRRRA